jgi:hypothetical protein
MKKLPFNPALMNRKIVHLLAGTLPFVVCAALAVGCNGQTQAPRLASPTAHDFRHPLNHDFWIIEHWAKITRRRVYAGTFYSAVGDGRLVVGFTRRQSFNLELIRKLPGIVEPSRIVVFAHLPKHSLVSIEGLQRRFGRDVESTEELQRLVTGWSLNVQRNAVSVGTEQPKLLRALLKQLYGRNSAFAVRRQPRGFET